MDHRLRRAEEHKIERKEKQLHERQAEKQFSKPGPAIRPFWFVLFGVFVTLGALFIWMGSWSTP